jgi:uncharacterized protein YdcH (DUF465 family)
MSDITVLEELNSKISLLLEKYESLKEENHTLEEALGTSRENEAKLRQEILKMKEDEELRNMELEDIVTRISSSIDIELNQVNMPMAS